MIFKCILQFMNQKYIVSYKECEWASARQNLSSVFANNTGTDKPALLRRLINAYVIRFLKSIIFKLATSEVTIV